MIAASEFAAGLRQALALHGAGCAAEAAARLDLLLAAAPPRHDALAELGMLALRLGRLEQGVEILRRSLEIEPTQPVVRAIRGAALVRLQRPQEALVELERAVAGSPNFAGAYFDRGCALRALGRLNEALADFDRAIELEPDNAAALANRGALLHELGRVQEALESSAKALALVPDYVQGRYNRAVILQSAGHRDAALLELAAVADAAELEPAARGNALLALGRIEEAVECLRRAGDLDAKLCDARSVLAMALLYREAGDDGSVAEAHRDFAARFEAPLAASAVPLRNSRDPDRRLRIGYVSGDFNAHSVAFFIEPVLAGHDRERFSVHAYDVSRRADEVTQRLRGLTDEWVHCAGVADERLAQRIRNDGIDILVDLSGHTAGNRRLVFARRPAPIQLCWIGYPADPGPPSIDFLISDPVASPPHGGGTGAHRLVRLPRIFSCYRAPPGAPGPAMPEDREKSEIMFCSFNNAAKLSPGVVDAWARILHELPGARLTLKDRSFVDAGARKRMLDRFAAQGVSAERIVTLARVASDIGHLALYREMDVALDTFPYCGVTTTCEALWMGVPVVSLAGEAFRSRMGATILSSIGHADWVAECNDRYVATAVALARSEILRRDLRGRLRQQMFDSPLMDEIGFVRDLEASYVDVWQRWCVDQRT